ncbi:MAG: hypothetical protein ABGW87_06765 [Sphingomonadaceae bacterium]
MRTGSLYRRKILLVEDDYMQARAVAECLQSVGALILGPTGRATEVPRLLASCTADAALLDINLGKGASFETADYLRRLGVSFAFLTGYDQSAIPSRLCSVPRLEKPASERALIRLVKYLLEGSPL